MATTTLARFDSEEGIAAIAERLLYADGFIGKYMAGEEEFEFTSETGAHRFAGWLEGRFPKVHAELTPVRVMSQYRRVEISPLTVYRITVWEGK